MYGFLRPEQTCLLQHLGILYQGLRIAHDLAEIPFEALYEERAGIGLDGLPRVGGIPNELYVAIEIEGQRTHLKLAHYYVSCILVSDCLAETPTDMPIQQGIRSPPATTIGLSYITVCHCRQCQGFLSSGQGVYL